MKKLLFCLSVFALAFPAHAATLIEDLGSKYNALILGDLTANGSDTAGRQLVTGNFETTVNLYTIGQAVGGAGEQNPASAGRDDMVVGGNYVYSGGSSGWVGVQVTEDAVVGGTADPAEVHFNAATSGISSGQGKLSANQGSLWVERTGESNVFTSAGADRVALADLKGMFQSESAQLSGFSQSAEVTVSGSTISVSGSAGKTYFANIAASALSSSISISAPVGSTLVVNVSGTGPTANGTSLSGGITENNVLMNFYEATAWTIQNNELHGAVLAPFTTSLNMSKAINGTAIIAGDVTTTPSTEFHNYPFRGTLVPEPGNAGLLGLLAAAGLSLRSRCRLAGGAA